MPNVMVALPNIGGHTMIRTQLERNVPLARVKGNYITPRYVFDKNYIVNIRGKDDW